MVMSVNAFREAEDVTEISLGSEGLEVLEDIFSEDYDPFASASASVVAVASVHGGGDGGPPPSVGEMKRRRKRASMLDDGTTPGGIGGGGGEGGGGGGGLLDALEANRANAVWLKTLEAHRRELRWFELAARGSEGDLAEMAALLGRDRYNRGYDAWDPRRLVNAVDGRNRTALYLAARNGNMRLLEFLLERGGNPCIACDAEDDDDVAESPLECAARWGHHAAVERLLRMHPDEHGATARRSRLTGQPLGRAHKYSKKDARNALKLSHTQSVRDLLSGYIRVKKNRRLNKLLPGRFGAFRSAVVSDSYTIL